MTEEIERCRQEQQRCVRWLSDNPAHPQIWFACLGANDWLVEELLILGLL